MSQNTKQCHTTQKITENCTVQVFILKTTIFSTVAQLNKTPDRTNTPEYKIVQQEYTA